MKNFDILNEKQFTSYVLSPNFNAEEFKRLWQSSKDQNFKFRNRERLDKKFRNSEILIKIIQGHLEIFGKLDKKNNNPKLEPEILKAKNWLNRRLQLESDFLATRPSALLGYQRTLAAGIESRLKTAGPWGCTLQSLSTLHLSLGDSFLYVTEKEIIEAAGKLNPPAYLHRNSLIREKLPPVAHSEIDGHLIFNKVELENWAKHSGKALLMLNAPDEKVRAWKHFFEVLRDWMNPLKRFTVDQIYANIVTNSYKLVLGMNLVKLQKTEFGIAGRIILYVNGLPDFCYQLLTSMGWVDSSTLFRNYSEISKFTAVKETDQFLFFVSDSLEEAEKALGLLLEEFLIFVMRQNVLGRQIFVVRFDESVQVKRTQYIKELNVREQWIRSYDRADPIDYCIVCGHGLSRAESVQRQIGPHCWEKVSREKRVKRADLQIGYSPVFYEGAIEQTVWLDSLKRLCQNLDLYSEGSLALPAGTYRLLG